MLHVLPKTSSVLEPDEEGVGMSPERPEKSSPTERSTALGTSFLNARIDETRPSTSSSEASSRTAKNTRWSTIAIPSSRTYPTESSRKAAKGCGALTHQSYGRRRKELFWSQDLFPENP